MSTLKDLIGQKFNRLTVISQSQKIPNVRITWVCVCECGTEVVVRHDHLIDGNTKSCGCLHKELTRKRNIIHGASYTQDYGVWRMMIQRCTNPNNSDYYNYGGRGIKVCNRWLCSIEDFYADMGLRPSLDHSIDRMNNDGNYEPGNCRWATAVEQANNRKSNVLYNYKGNDYTALQIFQKFGIKPNTFRDRIYAGWSVENAVEMPLKQ